MNIAKAIAENVPDAIHELMAERERLVERLHHINAEVAILITLSDLFLIAAGEMGLPRVKQSGEIALYGQPEILRAEGL